MIRRKWKSRRGETLVEALISLLIASLALTMLAGMIFKSKRLFENSRDDMEAYTTQINLLNDPTQKDPPLGASVTVSVVSGDPLVAIPGGALATIPVYYYTPDNTNAGGLIVSYVKSGA